MRSSKATAPMPPTITTHLPEALQAGDMVTVGTGGRQHRIQRGEDGATYLYPDWPGRNRHERRAAEKNARRG